MSEYIIDMPSDYNRDGIYHPDERHSGIPIVGEIVRCMDCRHYNDYQNLCERLRPGMLVIESDDGFCAWGERTPNG